MKNEAALKAYRDGIKNGSIEKPIPLDPLQKLATKPSSLRLAINAKCYDCTGFQKKEVKNCEMSDCPLHAVRPYQPK